MKHSPGVLSKIFCQLFNLRFILCKMESNNILSIYPYLFLGFITD
jgi:hypothetical protein